MAKTYLEPNEIEQLESAAIYLRDKLLIRLLFHLGCRISEAITLTVDDVDFSKGTVSIVHLKRRLQISCANCGARLGVSHTFCPRCGTKVKQPAAQESEYRRQRVLPVDQYSLDLLKDYIERGGPVMRDGKRLIFGINRHRMW